MKKVLVVRNIHAGRKTAIKYRRLLLDFLLAKQLDFKIIEVDELLNFDISEFDTLIAMGGDGTVNKCAKLIANSEKVLGIIPCGTANLLAFNLGIPLNVKKAIDLLGKKSLEIDLIDVNGEKSILRIGFGFDSNIICNTPQSLKNKFGYFAYFLSGILFSFRLKEKKYTFFVSDKKYEVNATCFIVCNACNMFRDFFRIANNSSPADSLFDVFILKTQNPLLFFYELLRIFFNVRNNNSRVLYLSTDNLCIHNQWLNAHIDGEKYNFSEDINFKINEKSVNIYVN